MLLPLREQHMYSPHMAQEWKSASHGTRMKTSNSKIYNNKQQIIKCRNAARWIIRTEQFRNEGT